MLKAYQQDFQIYSYQTDVMNQWRPSAILEVMQEMAGAHAELLGIGRNALLNRNLVWVLTRMEVEMDRYPVSHETVTVETFPMPVRRWFFPRYYVMRDAAGLEIGRAGSLWVLLDFTSRRMSRPDDVARCLPDNSDMIAPLGLPAPVTEVSGTLETATRLPVYTDLDCNQHVNNTRYMDWCCNALGVDAMKTHCLSRFMLNFDAEIRPGQEIRTELRRLGDDFSFCGFRGDSRCFDVGGTLMERR